MRCRDHHAVGLLDEQRDAAVALGKRPAISGRLDLDLALGAGLDVEYEHVVALDVEDQPGFAVVMERDRALEAMRLEIQWPHDA